MLSPVQTVRPRLVPSPAGEHVAPFSRCSPILHATAVTLPRLNRSTLERSKAPSYSCARGKCCWVSLPAPWHSFLHAASRLRLPHSRRDSCGKECGRHAQRLHPGCDLPSTPWLFSYMCPPPCTLACLREIHRDLWESEPQPLRTRMPCVP